MKRTALKRAKPLRSSGKGLKRSELKSVNHVRQSKRRAEYAKYLRSAEWKALRAEALERAGHRCEYEGLEWFHGGTLLLRCREKEQLSVHHLRYPRTLGSESVDTLQVLCKRHHELVENLKWWRKM